MFYKVNNKKCFLSSVIYPFTQLLSSSLWFPHIEFLFLLGICMSLFFFFLLSRSLEAFLQLPFASSSSDTLNFFFFSFMRIEVHTARSASRSTTSSCCTLFSGERRKKLRKNIYVERNEIILPLRIDRKSTR